MGSRPARVGVPGCTKAAIASFAVQIGHSLLLEIEVVSSAPGGTFPKSAHLLKRSDFRRVYEQGRRHVSRNMTIFYLCHAPGQRDDGARPLDASRSGQVKAPAAPVRIGFTVSRALGGAVERNRIRRRTREAVRHNYTLLAGLDGTMDVVINPRKSVLKAEFAKLSQEVAAAFAAVQRGSGQVAQQSGQAPLSQQTQNRRLPGAPAGSGHRQSRVQAKARGKA